MIPNSWWTTGLVGLIIVALLPIIGHSMRGDRGNRCAWDGLRIEPIYRVRILESTGDSIPFCCIQCAGNWLQRQPGENLEIFVTDESSGQELNFNQAHYVRSTISTNEVTGNRLHVFRLAENASKHANAAQGRILTVDERPFSKLERKGSETQSNVRQKQ